MVREGKNGSSELQQIVAGIAGGALALYGLSRRSLGLTALGSGVAVGAVGRDVLDALRAGSMARGERPLHVERSITIGRSPQELYAAWRGSELLSRVFPHVHSVSESDGVSHWVAEGPGGTRVEWDAAVETDEAARRIAWRSIAESRFGVEGEVRFDSAVRDRGTVVRLRMAYRVPAGSVGAVVATVSGYGVDKEAEEALRRFKQLMETGEIATIAGQPAARRRSRTDTIEMARRGREATSVYRQATTSEVRQ